MQDNCNTTINLNNPFRLLIELRQGNTVDGIRLNFFNDSSGTPMDFTDWEFETDFFTIEVELPNVLILSATALEMDTPLGRYDLDIQGTFQDKIQTVVAGKYEVKKDYLTSGCMQDGSSINLQYFNVIEKIIVQRDGWIVELAYIPYSDGTIAQIADYVGGEGDKPTEYIGWYLSDTGLVEDITDATIFGRQGDSAYIVAVKNGFVGTEAEWLQSLKQPAIDAGEYATEQGDYAKQVGEDTELVRLATEQVRQDTLTAKGETEQATLDANAAANNANSKATIAQTAANNANNAALNANDAADIAEQAAIDANLVKDNAIIATGNANDATNLANQAATNANDKAGIAQTAADNADIAAGNANNAFNLFKNYVNTLFGITEQELSDMIILAMNKGYAVPSQKWITRLNYFVKQWKFYNLKQHDDTLHFLAGDGSLDFKGINLWNSNDVANNALITWLGGLDSNQKGIKGNSLNAYGLIDTNLSTADKFKQNDAGVFAFITEYVEAALFGHVNYGGNRMYNATVGVQRLNSNTDGVTPSPVLNGLGLKAMNRVSNTSIIFSNESTQTSTSVANSYAVTAEKPTILRLQGNVYGGSRIGIFGIGKSVINPTDILNRRRCILNALVELDETREVINRAADEGFELPDQKTLFAIDLAIWKMKTTIISDRSLWDKTDLLLRFGYNNLALQNFSIINLRNPTSNLAQAINNPLYTLNGWEGDGVGAYIDTGFNPFLGNNNYTLNNARRGATVYKKPTNETSTSTTAIDSQGGGSENAMRNMIRNSQRINSGSNNLNIDTDLTGTGYTQIDRLNNNDVVLYKKDIEYKRLQTSVSIPNASMMLFRADGFSDLGLVDYDMGAAFNAAENLAYRNIMNELSISLGLTPYA